MADFCIKPTNVKTAASVMSDIGTRVEQLNNRLISIKQSLVISGLTAVSIKCHMDSISQSLTEEQKKVENLSDKLMSIVQIYEKNRVFNC